MGRTDGGSVRQLAVTPDGGQVIVPSGAPYYHPVLSTADLTQVDQYPTTAYPNAAWAHTLVDGGLAWGGDRLYAVTHILSEPDNLTLRIRVVG